MPSIHSNIVSVVSDTGSFVVFNMPGEVMKRGAFTKRLLFPKELEDFHHMLKTKIHFD